MHNPIRILVVGCGNMGGSHARAYHGIADFEIVGLVSHDPEMLARLSSELGGLPQFSDYEEAMAATQPDAVSINTYPDTHADFCTKAICAGYHVFVEKPLAETVEDAEAVVELATQAKRKVVVGYILRVHPIWQRFIETAKTLGKPLVMRMNLNQQSSGQTWSIHKNLMNFMSPMVDCGVHYVDVMCQMTGSPPVRVHAIGARLTDDVKPSMYNYGHLHVTFGDGSIGWYEAGWGPMMSQEALFVKDVVGPKGSVSIVEFDTNGQDGPDDATDSHSSTSGLRLHYSKLDGKGEFVRKDVDVRDLDDPDRQSLCQREQELFLRVIRDDLDMSQHLQDAVNSLRILLAADQSLRIGQVVDLTASSTSREPALALSVT
jgi:predicted dehydrogenase